MQNKKFYPFLDQLRAIAILWVLMRHMFVFFSYNDLFYSIYYMFLRFGINLKGFINWFGFVFQDVSRVGYLGVDMFFVISGFLITGLLLEGLNGDVDIKRFYKRRFFKIIPQYYFALIVVFICLVFFSKPLIPANFLNIMVDENIFYARYFIFMQNYFSQNPLLEHTWSLAVEEQFYILYPIFFLYCCRSAKSPLGRRKLLIVMCLFFVCFSHTARIYYYTTGGSLLWGFSANAIIQTTSFRMDALMVGCLLRLLEPYYEHCSIKLKVFAALCGVVGIAIYVGFISLTVSCFYSSQWYSFTLAYLAPAFLIFAAYQLLPQGIVPFKILSWIGRNSYGIYLWHYILIYPAVKLVGKLTILPTMTLYFLSAILFGAFTTQTIEKWGLALRNKVAP